MVSRSRINAPVIWSIRYKTYFNNMWFNHTLDSCSQVRRTIPLPVALLTTIETLSLAMATYLPFSFSLSLWFCNLWDWSNTWTTSAGLLLFFLSFYIDREEEEPFSTFKTLPPSLITPSTAWRELISSLIEKFIWFILKFSFNRANYWGNEWRVIST